MKREKDFIFTVNITAESYQNKKDASACLSSDGAKAIHRKKMCFFEREVNVDEFLLCATNGYAFCGIYKFEPNKKYWYEGKDGRKFNAYPYYRNKTKTSTVGALKIDFKRDEYFTETPVVYVDIDYTEFESMEYYIKNLQYVPTMGYYSFSDSQYKIDKQQKDNSKYDKEKGIWSRRFRLCYVFDKPLNKGEFITASKILTDKISLDTNETVQDKCGEQMSQYMNGTNNKDVFKSYIIYNYAELVKENYKNNIYNIIEDDVSSINNISEKSNTLEEDKLKPSQSFINDLKTLNPDQIYKKYSSKFKYIVRAEKDNWEKGYQIVDDNYFSLWFYREPLKDGERRRRNIYERMCLRRVLVKDDTTPDEILYDAWLEVFGKYAIVDNSVEPITVDNLISRVVKCYKYSLDQIEQFFEKTIKNLQSITRPKEGMIFNTKGMKRGEWLKMKKNVKYEYLDYAYDRTKSLKDNIKHNPLLNGVNEKYLYEYLEERGINTKKYSNEDIINLLDPELSVRKNQKMLLEKYDIKVGIEKIHKLLKEKYNNKSVLTDSSINNISEKSNTFIIDNNCSVSITEQHTIMDCTFCPSKEESPKYDTSAFLSGSNFGIRF